MPFSKTRGFQPRRTATLKGSPYTYRGARLSASPNGDPKGSPYTYCRARRSASPNGDPKGSPYTYRRARRSASPNGDPKRVALHVPWGEALSLAERRP